MKRISLTSKIVFAITVAISCLMLNQSIQAQQIVGPETKFDANEAKALLEPGKSTIKGIAYYAAKTALGISNMNKGTWKMNVKTEVFLYPMTKHLEEWLKISKKITYRKKIYRLSDECMKYYKSTFTDEYGKFEFKNLKPGKYYIWNNYEWYGRNEGDEKTIRLEDVAEIKTDGEVLDIKLKN